MTEVARREVSSLDRYLANRAPKLLWSTNAARASVINTRVGIGLLALAGVISAIGLAVEGPIAMVTALGPAIAGLVNLGIGWAWRSRARLTSGNTEISSEVWKFLHGLTTHVLGPSYVFRASNMGYYPVSNTWNGWRMTPRASGADGSSGAGDGVTRSVREILDPRVFGLLDEAARHYNRVQGHITHSADGPGGLLPAASRIQMAADQAMLDAIRIGSTMQQFPENIETLSPSLDACTVALKEAADLVGKLVGPRVLAASPKEQAVLLRGMLDDLRIESLARSELSDVEPPAIEQQE